MVRTARVPQPGKSEASPVPEDEVSYARHIKAMKNEFAKVGFNNVAAISFDVKVLHIR